MIIRHKESSILIWIFLRKPRKFHFSQQLVWFKYGDYEYATIGSVVNKNFDSRFEVICLKILGTELSAWAT